MPLWMCDMPDAEAYDEARDLSIQLELQSFLATIDLEALARRASAVRGDRIACAVATPNFDKDSLSSAMGNVNYHVELRFDDGVCWIARIKRQNASTPPAPVRDYMIQSEAATYSFLARTKVPAPRVFEVVLGADNLVGAGYILMEKIPGKPLTSIPKSPEQKRKVLGQLASVYAELEKHPFPAIGSLDEIGTDHVGPLASELLADLNETRPNLLGSFSTSAAYYEAMITRVLGLITSGQLYPLWAVDAFLIHRFLLDLVPQLSLPTSAPTEGHGSREEHFLRHADDKGDHILVDDEFNITGIIDWEWAYTAPKSEAFSSPMALWNVGDFFEGENRLSEHEKLFAELLDAQQCENETDSCLGRYVREGRKWQRFRFCAGYEIYDWDWENYKALFEGLRKVFDVDAEMSWEDWKAQALDRYRNDTQLGALLDA
ncbi:MAG: hypothetical protein M4579_003419 [Chaenotheca gracillima]|nr:MAG: hypothetical protein M4579_003419 [Chaenotheca gracillima]